MKISFDQLIDTFLRIRIKDASLSPDIAQEYKEAIFNRYNEKERKEFLNDKNFLAQFYAFKSLEHFAHDFETKQS